MYKVILLLTVLLFVFVACGSVDVFDNVKFELKQGNKTNAAKLLKNIKRNSNNSIVYDSLLNVIKTELLNTKKLF